MIERDKLEEAKYFYDRMLEVQMNREFFTYNLSAFLSASRSILQYAYNKIKNDSDKKQWYNNWISKSPVLKFFREKRNINIHEMPITPSKYYEVTLKETIYVSDSVIISSGDKKISSQNNKSLPSKKDDHTPNVKIMYKFSDWSGDEDVLTLCRIYLQELEKFIDEGIKKGFLLK